MKAYLGALLGIGAGLLTVEVLLRLLLLSAPLPVNHPVLGRIGGAGLYISGSEGYAWAKMNRLGNRGPEPEAVEDHRHAVFLGDSYTEALQIPEGDLFVDLIARAWPERHVFNAARSGNSPATYLGLADFVRETYAPDDVFIQLEPRDFLSDLLDANKTFYVEPKEGTFELKRNSGRFEAKNTLTRNFPILEPLTNVDLLRFGLEKLKGLREGTVPPRQASPAMDEAALRGLVRWTLGRITATYPGATFFYLPVVDYYALEAPSRSGATRSPTLVQLTSDQTRSLAVEQSLEVEAKRMGLPFLNLRAAFEREFRSTRRMAHGFSNTVPGTGHINRLGHALTASELVAMDTVN